MDSEVRANKPTRETVRGWMRPNRGLLPAQDTCNVDRWSPRTRAAAYLIQYLTDNTGMGPRYAAQVARHAAGLEPLGESQRESEGQMMALGPGAVLFIHREVLAACHVPGWETDGGSTGV